MFATLIATTPLPCLAGTKPAPIPISKTIGGADRLPRRTVSIGDVTVYPDLVYSTVPGFRPLLLDLYLPPGKGRRPLVVFVHGGSWTFGSKRLTGHYADFPGVLASLARRGFAVASIDYRLSGEAKFPAALEDVKSAIRYLRSNADHFGIDRNRVALWGASAGAHLAAMAALTGDDPAFKPSDRENSGQSDRVQALVGWYGPYDMSSMFNQATMTSYASESALTPELSAETTGPFDFFGCTPQGCPPGTLEQASPVTYIDRNDPPTLLIHGNDDTSVPPGQSVDFHNRLKAAGVSADLLLIERAGHSWSCAEETETASASRKALAATFEWLGKTLQNKVGK